MLTAKNYKIITLILVYDASKQSSKRMLYPTKPPKMLPFSSATLCARVVAATLLGSVIPTTFPSSHQPASNKYYDSEET